MSKGVISMSKYEKSTRPITYEDKIKIRELREQGIGYMKIGKLTGLSRDQVRGFCKRDDGGPIRQNTGSYIPQKTCVVCEHTLNNRGRYCSDSCRKIGYDTLMSRNKPKRKIEPSDRVMIRDKTIEGFRAVDIAKSIGLSRAQVQGVIDHVRNNNIQHDDGYYDGIFTFTPFENECRECGKIYMASSSASVTCSDSCMRHRKNRLNEISRRTKLKENGPIDYDISIPKLIERDGLDCYLCGGQVNTEIHYNDDDYPNIDHVYPVSKGGTHTWDNVKLTHRKCNMMKRDFVISPGSTFHTNVLTKL